MADQRSPPPPTSGCSISSGTVTMSTGLPPSLQPLRASEPGSPIGFCKATEDVFPTSITPPPPSTGVSRSLVTDDPGGWPSRLDHPSFPGGNRALGPPGHTARSWISTDQPCGRNGKEVSTREHLFTPCPATWETHHHRFCLDNWLRPDIPAPGATDGRRAPASGSTFTSIGLSSWAVRSSRAIREDNIPGRASWLRPLPPPGAPHCHSGLH